jgi:hypothetical protein
MPIKKRKNLPKAPLQVERNTLVSSPPGPSLESLVKKHDQIASDAAWEGDNAKADFHQKQADNYRERLASGEIWEVDF